MHVIVAYDVKADRTQIFKKICERYLPRVQNSVFEGEMKKSQILQMRYSIEKEINQDETARIWQISEGQIFKAVVIGKNSEFAENIL